MTSSIHRLRDAAEEEGGRCPGDITAVVGLAESNSDVTHLQAALGSFELKLGEETDGGEVVSDGRLLQDETSVRVKRSSGCRALLRNTPPGPHREKRVAPAEMTSLFPEQKEATGRWQDSLRSNGRAFISSESP